MTLPYRHHNLTPLTDKLTNSLGNAVICGGSLDADGLAGAAVDVGERSAIPSLAVLHLRESRLLKW